MFSGSQPRADVVTASSPDVKLSIISTTTQTLTEDVTDVTTTDYPLHKNEQVFPEQIAARRASSSTELTTISLATTTTGFVTEDVTETTTAVSDVTEEELTSRRHRDTTLKTLRQNESKSSEVTTVTGAGVRSVIGDNQMMTTPIPQDLQLSESITSVYLHNSSSVPAVSNNINTQTKPIKDSNSITLVPFSKLSSHITREPQTSTVTPTSPGQEKVFTVTPVSAETTSSTMMTYDDLVTTAVTETPEVTTMMALYSGQYHEVNPGQYHEVNPGQYYETNPGNRASDFLLNSQAQ